MELTGSTALVTGANRGLGRHFAEQLLARGATVYAAARNPESVDLPGAIPIQLDVTDQASIAAAVETVRAAGGLSVLINNAGSFTGASLQAGTDADIRTEMNVHYFGTFDVTRAFAPLLAQAGSSAVLNVLSVLSWFTAPGFAPYAAAKSAEWSLTNAQRIWLAEQGTLVAGLHVGYMDTDMTAAFEVDKLDPAGVAKLGLDGLEAGAYEILADDLSVGVQAGLAGGVAAIYPQFA
jgi:NAD(P)-dependent dehydrogenase (short-subunit alcohol dehydrogenase family)